ncbi:TPA: hypothetical protein IAD41_05715 [Candidatus Scatenecus faecavium]|uniref:Uncharacterized protein n=1 Tax=Candidatus Scatenecus faecavium TaxID=2840915 RepID=A0A9D1FVX7_9BACT|nr:hypothetical protein [Candidatus Scatenecus faecavium]
MLLEESKRRQELLKQYIWELAAQCFESEKIREYAFKLKDLYNNNFRHSYSEFFPIIVDIAKEENYNLEFLSSNIEELKNILEQDYTKEDKKREFKGLYKSLVKLGDHLNLEIGRYNYFSSSEKKLIDIEKYTETSQDKLTHATSELENAKEKIHAMQTELIAVLSIFAAIVLTFSCSINLIGSVLTHMNEAPFFKATFFTLLCGFIVINLIFVMMYFISKIIGRSIYASCKTTNCTCGENNTPSCNSLNRIRKRLPYIFWLNIFIITLMISSLIMYKI